MPSYDYLCEATGRIVEVKHSMNTKLTTWGEVCGLAGLDTGDVPPETPAIRLITGGSLVKSSVLKNAEPPCGSPNNRCCGGQCMH